MPTVSVIICAYNAQQYLRQTIESVIAQTYQDWELVIVDDGSKDSTPAIVEEMIRRGVTIRYQYQQNRGFGHSRARALELATGEWVAIIDHDDLCSPNRLEEQINCALKNPDAALIFSDSEHFQDDGQVLRRQFEVASPLGLSLSAVSAAEGLLLRSCFIDSETVFFRREEALAIGGFDPRYKFVTDYDFFLRMGERYAFAMVNKVLAQWRVHARQLTQTAHEVILSEHAQLYGEWAYKPGISSQARSVAAFRSYVFELRLLRFYAQQKNWSAFGKSLKRFASRKPTFFGALIWARHKIASHDQARLSSGVLASRP